MLMTITTWTPVCSDLANGIIIDENPDNLKYWRISMSVVKKEGGSISHHTDTTYKAEWAQNKRRKRKNARRKQASRSRLNLSLSNYTANFELKNDAAFEMRGITLDSSSECWRPARHMMTVFFDFHLTWSRTNTTRDFANKRVADEERLDRGNGKPQHCSSPMQSQSKSRVCGPIIAQVSKLRVAELWDLMQVISG